MTAPAVTIQGDDAKLAKLRAKLRRAARKALVEDVALRVAPELVRLARASVAAGTNPYGEAWAPLSEGGAATLHGVIASLAAKAAGTRVQVSARHPGAAVHQYGAVIRPKRKAGGRGGYREGKFLRFEIGGRVVFARKVEIPRRQYMPEADRGLPASWTEAFGRVADAAIAKAFEG